MNPARLLLLFVAGCFAALEPLPADDTLSPLGLIQQYSADMVITTKDGKDLNDKISMDNGKVRSEMNAQGMDIVSIVRPDQKKVYSVMVAQKMVMVLPYDPEKVKQQMPLTTATEGKFELVGPDAVAGVPCLKYKMINADNRVFFMWIDPAKKCPVKLVADDGSVTIVWSNYKAGPQDPALFEPPADYQVMTMPTMPGGQ